ncbi:hypothetical protein ACA614_15950 [Lactiplantibacillus plantarum]|uniref:hypothetical protein n=1 Tax=Lactiplantibacillus plantarum TaxID=1590 RepID=UPI003C2515B9
MDKKKEFEETKAQGEEKLAKIKAAAESSDPEQALAKQKMSIDEMKTRTTDKLTALKENKSARYSAAKKKANRRWDNRHREQKRYITYRSRANKFIEMATREDLTALDDKIRAQIER